MDSASVIDAPARSKASSGKYLTFALGTEQYGLEILKVREIIAAMDIAAVPRMPAYVKGVINLRGQVISVVDLRARLGMEPVERTDRTCIIIVEVERDGRPIRAGITVDRVLEVLELPATQIEGPPSLGLTVASDVLLGIGKTGGSVTLLLDIARCITRQDAAAIPALQMTN